MDCLLFIISIAALVDARKTSLTGVQNSKKNRLAATRLGHQNSTKKIGSPLRGSWTLGQTPPPWKKKLDPPLYVAHIDFHEVVS